MQSTLHPYDQSTREKDSLFMRLKLSGSLFIKAWPSPGYTYTVASPPPDVILFTYSSTSYGHRMDSIYEFSRACAPSPWRYTRSSCCHSFIAWLAGHQSSEEELQDRLGAHAHPRKEASYHSKWSLECTWICVLSMLSLPCLMVHHKGHIIT